MSLPERPPNPPGRDRVAYRLATHPVFKRAMLDAVADADHPLLARLTTRADDDWTVALIDAAAMMGDVLAFYQERLAQEAWLRTATERRSVRYLARHLDYELGPGKAANAWLAFTLETAPGAPASVDLDTGLTVMSVPGPGEEMQTFETVEAITARPDFNAIRPRMERPQTLAGIAEGRLARVAGLRGDIRAGERLLLVREADGGGPDYETGLFVESVTPEPRPQTTRLALAATTPRYWLAPLLPIAVTPVFQLEPLSVTAGWARSAVFGKRVRQADLTAALSVHRQPVADLSRHIRLEIAKPPEPEPDPEVATGLYRFRARAAVFGHNAPTVDSGAREAFDRIFDELGTGSPPTPSAPGKLRREFTGSDGALRLALDAEYPEAVPGGYVMIGDPANGRAFQAFRIVDNAPVGAAKYGLSATVSRIEIDAREDDFTGYVTRSTVVLLQSERLELPAVPVTDDVAGSEIVLDGPYLDLAEGRALAVIGERVDLDGATASAIRVAERVDLADGHTVVTLDRPLDHALRRDTVRINANVARATHGETREQPIGDGDARKAGQRFRLPDKPLTHVTAATPSGVAPELEIRVDGVAWRRVRRLHDAGPEDPVYALSYNEDGSASVEFGDGVHGARLPTGPEIVTARWRVGSALAGRLAADALSLPGSRPLGLKGVTNPVPTAGAADPETLNDARRTAPTNVLTFGRVVSLSDYADFARARPAFAKAHVAWVWLGTRRGVFVTVAGADGLAVTADPADIRALEADYRRYGAPHVPVMVRNARPRRFRLRARIKALPGHAVEAVDAGCCAALAAAFGFAARDLGQPVARSEVLAVLQGVEGVDWVDLDALYVDVEDLPRRLPAPAPQGGTRLAPGAEPEPAVLLLLDPRPAELTLLPASEATP